MDTFRAYLCLGKQVCQGILGRPGDPGAGYPSGDTCIQIVQISV